jgi:hypothetical protein
VLETTLGFDLRSIIPDPGWTADRRSRYLLRRDVASVRSVDTHVWEQSPGLPSPPEFEMLWPDLPSLLEAARDLDRADVTVVRITAFAEDGATEENVEPAIQQHELLGYDVADYGLIGGLTNCGYSPDEAASLVPTWAPLLNKWHLFDNADDATAFATVKDTRVPAHAPFYVYGIYQLG